MKAQTHIRSQHRVGNVNGKFGGPDTYVAVTIAPDDALVPKYLNRQVLQRRGIQLIHCGEGYSQHRGPKSMLGRALKLAETIVQEVERIRQSNITFSKVYETHLPVADHWIVEVLMDGFRHMWSASDDAHLPNGVFAYCGSEISINDSWTVTPWDKLPVGLQRAIQRVMKNLTGLEEVTDLMREKYCR